MDVAGIHVPARQPWPGDGFLTGTTALSKTIVVRSVCARRLLAPLAAIDPGAARLPAPTLIALPAGRLLGHERVLQT